MRFPDKKIQKQIGYNFVLSHLNTVSPMGHDLKNNLKPFGINKKQELKKEFDKMEVIMNNIIVDKEYSDNLIHEISKIKEIRTTVKRLDNNVVLDEIELFELKLYSNTLINIARMYKEKNIEINGINLVDLSDIFEILDPNKKKILTFYIYELYSDKLKKIREDKKEIEDKIIKSRHDKDLMDKLLLERTDIVANEEDEEYIIREKLSKKLKVYLNQIDISLKSLALLDFLLAKCSLAKQFKCTKPIIVDEYMISLKDAFHPEISAILHAKKKDFVKLNLELSKGVSLLTGANMGGKSVTIKTVTLNVYLVQLGLYAFAKEMKTAVFNFIHYVSDDMQSIERGLSTFGAEMIRLKEILNYVNATDGFVALDEFARGTNPSEGSSIVNGLIEYLSKKDSVSFISTHYDGISLENVKHYQVVGLENVDFDSLKYKISLSEEESIDILQEYMDYSLKIADNSIVPKDALNIATLLGVQEDFIDYVLKWYDK